MRNFYTKSLLTLLLSLCCAVVSAQSFESNGISYSILSLSDRTVEVAHNANYQGFIIIPSTTDYSGISFKVTGIGDGAFSGTNVTEMIISEGVTHIGDSAFYASTLKEIIIPNSVTSIGSRAFRDCTSLTSITIPNSVTSIGDYAFSYCYGLTSVTIGNSVTSIGNSAFFGCSGLTVHISDLSAWCKIDFSNDDSNPLRLAKNLYLNGEKITNLVIPSDITEIKDYAFLGCTGLESITIPNSVTSIGNDAFYSCDGLTAVHISDLSAWCKIDFSNDYSNPLRLPLAKNLYLNGENITNLVIPSDITEIKDYAFINCDGLTSITIPNSVTSIGGSAFSDCSGLRIVYNNSSLDITAGSSNYGYVAYYANIIVTKDDDIQGDFIFRTAYYTNTLIAYAGNDSVITLPENYNDENYAIGEKAFRNCTGLTSVTMGNSVTSIGDKAFYSCTGLTSATMGNSVTSIGDKAFYYCTGLTSVTIGNSVTSIGDEAFYYCDGLTSITIPNSVTSIGDEAFYYCYGLTSITIPNNITTIGRYTFYNCKSLTSITIPNSVITIGDGAFKNCTGLTSITIPNSVTSIGGSAFYYCTGLTSITIPNSVTSIGDDAFYHCTGLTEMYVKATTPPSADYQTFYNVPKTIPVYVPAGTKAAYQAADYWKDFTNIIEMDFGIKGDVDGDETVDVADVTAVVEVILNGEETEEVPTEQTFDAWTSTNTAHSSTSQNSYTMEATEGSVLTFDWEVSSESNYDWLIITIDGTQILKKSGNDSGSYTHTFTIAGTHTLVVKYTKDGSRNSGSDKGGIYNIKLSGSANNKSNPAADVDGDGSIDVADVTEVVNIILNSDSDDDDNTTVTPGTPTTDSRAVDLGLPSGLKWASCNVGATAPEEYGGYYAWGETEEKSDYSWDTYKYCNGTGDSMTKYCTYSNYGIVDNKTTLEASDDVATVKWGGNWRIPTKAEINELCSNCTWEWTTLNGVNGYRVTGPNGNSIFLPDAGFRYGTTVYNQGFDVSYWSSSLGSSYSYCAYFLVINSSSYKWKISDRYYGRSVRPVCP